MQWTNRMLDLMCEVSISARRRIVSVELQDVWTSKTFWTSYFQSFALVSDRDSRETWHTLSESYGVFHVKQVVHHSLLEQAQIGA